MAFHSCPKIAPSRKKFFLVCLCKDKKSEKIFLCGFKYNFQTRKIAISHKNMGGESSSSNNNNNNNPAPLQKNGEETLFDLFEVGTEFMNNSAEYVILVKPSEQKRYLWVISCITVCATLVVMMYLMSEGMRSLGLNSYCKQVDFVSLAIVLFVCGLLYSVISGFDELWDDNPDPKSLAEYWQTRNVDEKRQIIYKAIDDFQLAKSLKQETPFEFFVLQALNRPQQITIVKQQ